MSQALSTKVVSLVNECSNADSLLTGVDNAILTQICGEHHRHIGIIETELQVSCLQQGAEFVLQGVSTAIQQAEKVLIALYYLAQRELITDAQVHQMIQQQPSPSTITDSICVRTPLKTIHPKSEHQTQYFKAIDKDDIVFAVGPAGTGKTYLAVAKAVEAFLQHQVHRIILVRPIVEAGEHLGFLPGDIGQKIDPYLRPLYDALYAFLGAEKVNKLMEQNAIELAPLAYMRGRTLSEAFIIMDEAQNTTVAQMKMLLTRLGYGAKAVITGDISQVDLPKGSLSGLQHALSVLDKVRGVSVQQFSGKDIVRHPLVQRVVEAYEKQEK